MNIKKGDTVVVTSGADKGKQGKVLVVYPAKQKLLVEGVQLKTHHVKKSQQNPNGGLLKKEAPIYSCKVSLASQEGKAIKVSRTHHQKDGKVLVNRKTGEVIRPIKKSVEAK
ncbi:MAG: 50S ribosomal protein L24 [Chlamydiae bacterium]|nr:50S ribosomal protein L24 [Chlamydiota bacterium]